VTDGNGNLLGIISEKDVLGIAHTPQAPKRRVDEVMRSNVIVYDEASPLAHILNFLTRAPIRSVIVTSQGKPTGLISRASVVRWFLENRWNERKSELQTAAAEGSARGNPSSESALWVMSDQLVAMAHELHQFLRDGSAAADPAPIVGGASRMQQLLDDLVSGYSRRDSADHGLPS
jgi:hypothetical protein